jgi:hypothetical protein
MNEISPIRAPLVATAHGIIPTDFESVWRMATVLCKTGMIPVNFKDKPEDTAAAIMWGMEIGLSPIVALQSIAVINGRPSLWGDTLPAMITKAGHKLDEVIEGDGATLKATCTLTRRDGHKVSRSFSMADAKRAGLSTKTGPWTQYPQRMVQMRARSWAVRDGAADVLRGLQVVEEQQDAMRDITPAQTKRAVLEIPDIPDAPPPDNPPELLADQDGALDMIADAYSQCDCEAEVIALQEQYADLINRMSPENKTRAIAILVVPE